MSTASVRAEWEGRLVGGRFALLEWLGGSEDRGVFLTILPGAQKAAIMLILAEGMDADAYLVHWMASKALSHPGLMGLLEAGRCVIEGTNLVYVVTQYAENSLAQIIRERALGVDDARAIFDPVLDALLYLHGKGFVHGHVKPANILIVAGQVKLSGDDLSVAGEVPKRARTPGIYDAPEITTGTLTSAADSWSLGMTLATSLTQRPVVWDRSAKRQPVVPETLPQPFGEIVRECLRLDPADRCTVRDVKASLGRNVSHPIAPETIPPVVEPVRKEPSARVPEPVRVAPDPIDEMDPADFIRSRAPSADIEEPITRATEPAPVAPDSIDEVDPPDFIRSPNLFADIEAANLTRAPALPLVIGVIAVLAIVAALLLQNNVIKLSWPFQNISAPATSQVTPPPQSQAPSPNQAQSSPPAGQAAQPQPPPARLDQTQGAPASGQTTPPSQPPAASPDQAQSAPETGQVAPQPQPRESSPAQVESASRTGRAELQAQSQAPRMTHPARSEGAIAKRVFPDVPETARGSIRGTKEAVVRVWVDRNGRVSNAAYVSQGPGNYFARSAMRAALLWRFVPPNLDGQARSSVWILRFYFSQTKTEVTAIEEER
ncbi:MAG: TonB family protein [Terracidiphilus sp.]